MAASANPNVIPPWEVITDTDKGGLVLVIGILFMIFSLFCLGIRAWTRVGERTRNWKHDDTCATIATFIAVVQSALVFRAVHLGFAEATKNLTAEQVAGIGKLMFASDIFYILGMLLSKLSTLLLLQRLSPSRKHAFMVRGACVLSIVWAIAAICLISFGCGAGQPYKDLEGNCPGFSTRWTVICCVDGLSETAILIIPVCLVYGLQMPGKSKAGVMFAFGVRFITAIAAALRLIAIMHQLRTPTNQTLSGAIVATWTQIELNYSIMAATFCCIGPFLSPFEKGGKASYPSGVFHSQRSIPIGGPSAPIPIDFSNHSDRPPSASIQKTTTIFTESMPGTQLPQTLKEEFQLYPLSHAPPPRRPESLIHVRHTSHGAEHGEIHSHPSQSDANSCVSFESNNSEKHIVEGRSGR